MPHKSKLDIVFWAFPSWHGDYMKSTVELAKELALRHRVLYIDYAYTIKDLLIKSNDPFMPSERIVSRKKSLCEVKLENGATINVLSLPAIIPFNWTKSKHIYGAIQGINKKIISGRIRHAIKQLSFSADVAINAFNPFFADAMINEFKDAVIVYYCYDNIDAAKWASVHGGRLELQFLEQADTLIFSSETLQKNKKTIAESYVVNNGVDLRAFNNVDATLTKNNDRRVIGYTGSIDDRLDYDLLEGLIDANPKYDFKFIGRIMTNESERLRRFPNVEFFGPVSPASLPALMQDFDLGIIPFRKNDFTKNIYPMKVNEYLALGIPVVSTDVAQLDDLSLFMDIADTAEEFSAKARKSLANDNTEIQTARKEKARSNSWTAKALEFEKILLKYV